MSQCMHKKNVRDTTFYCIERRGHQCDHHYHALMSDVEHFATKLATAEAELATARRDAQRLDWLQEQYTLHQGADIFYTVDGYAIELLTEDGNHVLHSWHGDTLRTAIDAALSTAGTTERGEG